LAADGLDDVNWDLLRQSVIAANSGDAEAHVAALQRHEHEAPVDDKAGAYLWYLLRYRVAVLLGRRPRPQDLHDLAGRYYPEFSRLIRGIGADSRTRSLLYSSLRPWIER
jgi:hypothetical protein